jgi:NAD-dependent deacetylase
MAVTIDFSGEPDGALLAEAARCFRSASRPVALSGAGISTESGIPDFRSPGGLWETYPPEDYASIDTFIVDPARAWILFAAMGETIRGASPNPAHGALADLEKEGLLAGVITQNIDGLHQEAGSRNVIEIHGDYKHLQCIYCRRIENADADALVSTDPPLCPGCGKALKPNVVLFGEAIRGAVEIQNLVSGCDLLLVVGTSAVVYPAAAVPLMVRQTGGALFEFNVEETHLTRMDFGEENFLFLGKAGTTLPAFARAVLEPS